MLAAFTTLSASQVRAPGPALHNASDLAARGHAAASRGAAMAAAPWMSAVGGAALEPPLNP